jgi:hypothetical protein
LPTHSLGKNNQKQKVTDRPRNPPPSFLSGTGAWSPAGFKLCRPRPGTGEIRKAAIPALAGSQVKQMQNNPEHI